MIIFGTCVGYPEKYNLYVKSVISINKYSDNMLINIPSNGKNIFSIYSDLINKTKRYNPYALVLMHDDLEFKDNFLSAKIIDIFRNNDIAIIGLIGAVNVKSLCWWEGYRRGRVIDDKFGLHDFGFGYKNQPCDVDVVDGMCLILSNWAIHNLSLDNTGYYGFHGYDAELCFQAHSKNKRVVVADIEAHHHSCGGITGDYKQYQLAEENFQNRWFKKC